MAEEFTCAVDETSRYACKGLDFYGEHEGKRYCVLHYPGEDKEDLFEQVKESKLALEDYDFRDTVFPEGTSDFKGFQFDADVDFAGATFLGKADFENAEFRGGDTWFPQAKFCGAWTSFMRAKFSAASGANFVGAEFSGARKVFDDAEFSGEQTSFMGATFSGELTSFMRTKFTSERTDFSEVQFSDESETDFSNALFHGEVILRPRRRYFLHSPRFRGTHFENAKFSAEQTDFSEVQFRDEWTDFSNALFRGAQTYFQDATFTKEVNFARATFKEGASFWGNKANLIFDSGAWAWFNSFRIEKPELLTFNTVLLHPAWFVHTDVRKVDFTAVAWYGMPGGPKGTLAEEVDALRTWDALRTQRRDLLERPQQVESPHALLSQTCRRLSANAEENREYPLANEFHYWSMDAYRKESWDYQKETWDGLLWIRRNWLPVAKRCGLATTLRLVWGRLSTRHRSRPRSFGLIRTLYWALSGYGVRAARAFMALLIIWGVFITFYVLVPSSPFSVLPLSEVKTTDVYSLGAPIQSTHVLVPLHWPSELGKAAIYSLGAIVRLPPEPHPNGPSGFQLLVISEGIVGPLQIALLALAIRRQVMR